MTLKPNAEAAEAVILYGRASFDRTQALKQLREQVEERLPHGWQESRIEIAFGDLTGPSLPQVLDELMREGVRSAAIVTCMVPADPALSTWLAGALNQWRQDRGTEMQVRLLPPVEQAIDLADAVAELLSQPESRDVALTEPSLGKPGWSKVPEHNRQIYFCIGARCAHRLAQPLFQHLRAKMKQHRALGAGPERVMCVRCSCLFPCNLGPLMTVYPGGFWYGGLTEARIDRIVEEHLVGGTPVQEFIVHVTEDHVTED
ncbi:(2Fe-2S) ferredoxin domain-containing protein [Methyloligella sp. 2.7D]|uniref:(2Fe-2S) ferredoxin domain-containing protein n=1 Tax=unclassified Methyloligella TaxID=2625955 RepID=UPI00157D4B38|nr:(2Fe-2S) ferredoxin domain-containing protein [Methyloligella sp. GL2]QKP78229.1 (2Fe-2S) ferredoxin domain-containing protein [Methyloligella sp. GL2]